MSLTNTALSAAFDPGFEISRKEPLGFSYGPSSFGPMPEIRTLDSIRASLREPDCTGPEEVYAIAMDVGRRRDMPDLYRRMLLYGVVTYAKGKLGTEPVRSQGHIHKISAHCGWSTPEVYEIWEGKAVILMQESAKDNPGRCYAVCAGPGEVVIVPPGWAHATVSADPRVPLTFGAWCDRDYGFVYDDVRAHGGLAYFPVLDDRDRMTWIPNPRYHAEPLIEKSPEDYKNLGLRPGVPIYKQYLDNPDTFDFVSDPGRVISVWRDFVP